MDVVMRVRVIGVVIGVWAMLGRWVARAGARIVVRVTGRERAIARDAAKFRAMIGTRP